MTTENAVAAERAAIVRAIKAEAEDYIAYATALPLDALTPDGRSERELRVAAGALRRVAVVISQREDISHD
jgi:hypothetical protein